MSLQAFLARLYVDADFRRDFFASPRQVATRAGLSIDDVASVETMNPAEVELAAASFRSKRESALRTGAVRLDRRASPGRD